MTLITETAVLSCEGYAVSYGVTVREYDNIIGINGTTHRKEELDINIDGRVITSRLADWEVTW